MTTPTNSYHNTEYRTRKTWQEIDAILNTHPSELTPADQAFVRRADATLCGIGGCSCGNGLGEQ
jgi:hypothetical protein